MKAGWIAGAVLLCAAALLLFARGRDPGPDETAAPDGPRTRLARRGEDRAGAPAGDERTGGPGAIGNYSRERRAGAPAADSGRAGAAGANRALGPGASDRQPQAGALGGAGGAGAGATLDRTRAGERQAAEREAPEAGSTGADAWVDAQGEPVADVAYDGGTEKVFPTDSQEQVADAGPISGRAGTVSFWLKPEWQAGDQNDATLIQLGDSGLEVVKNVSFLRFQYTDSSGVERGLGASLAQWPPGQWRHVAASWVDGHLMLYIDGKMVSQDRYQAPPEFQAETKLYVGSAFASGAPASRAQITGLLVLNRDAAAGEIGAQFDAGAPPAP